MTAGDNPERLRLEAAFAMLCGVAPLPAVLSRTGRSRWTSPWITFVVGVHLVPLASLLAYPMLYAVALAAVGVALAAVPLARARAVAISAVTGLGVGSVLLLASLASLVTVLP